MRAFIEEKNLNSGHRDFAQRSSLMSLYQDTAIDLLFCSVSLLVLMGLFLHVLVCVRLFTTTNLFPTWSRI